VEVFSMSRNVVEAIREIWDISKSYSGKIRGMLSEVQGGRIAK
jgi:hypothetical protein